MLPAPLRTLLVAAVATTLLLAGCRSTSGGSTPDPTGPTLDNDSVVFTADGIAVGATADALSDQISVTSAAVASPPPLPGGWSLAGEVYEVGASEPVIVDNDAALLLGLPVPDGVDPSTVAVAGYLPTIDYALRGAEPAAAEWIAVDSVYDAESGVVYTPFYALDAGTPFALVVGSDAEPPVGTAGATLRAQAETAGPFGAVCRRFGDGECSAAVEQQIADRAEAFRVAFVNARGFKNPGLRPLVADAGFSLIPPRVNVTVARYALQIRPSDTNACDGKNGSYNSVLRRFVICKDRNQATFSDQELQTVDHEVFHAIQFKYGETALDWIAPRNRWVTEAMATSVERSRATAEGDRDRFTRDVDVALTRGEATRIQNDGSTVTISDVEYQAQDFWNFIANRYGSDIDYLDAVLRNGIGLNDIDETLRAEFGDGLADVYWDWAKNQAFETRVDIGLQPTFNSDGERTGTRPLLNDPCVLNPDALINGSDGVIELDYVRGSGVAFSGRVGVPPLSSRVIAFNLQPDSSAYVATLRLGGTDSTFPAKFYVDRSSASQACWSEPDGRTASFGVPANTARTVYALVSNTELLAFQQTDDDGNDDLRFFVSGTDVGGPEVTFTAPTETSDVPEGFLTSFDVDVSTPSGNWTTDWFVDDARQTSGGPSSFGTRLCPGQRTVRAVVTDSEFGIQGEAELTLDVVNNAPTVDIVGSVPSAVGEGEPFTLLGQVTDVSCADPSGTADLDPLDFAWTIEDGLPSSAPGATLLTQFTSETTGTATNTVSLSYQDRGSPRLTGSASVEIDVTAPAPGGYPPEVAIRAPQDGLEFFATPNVTLDFSGVASGGLTGDLIWESRRSDGSDWTAWTEFGTGDTVNDVRFHNDDCDGFNCITTFQIRLRIDGYGTFGDPDPLQTIEFTLYLAG